MGGRIDVYIDVASLYSYIAFHQLLKNQDVLKQHGVEVEIHPILLGAMNGSTGNKPPWTLPAKAAYLKHDSRRSLAFAGLTGASAPGDLMVAGRTQLPMRALHHVKTRHPAAAYEAAWRRLLRAFWVLHRPPNTPEALAAALSSAGESGEASPFTADEVRDIVAAAASAECKDALRRTTDEALGRGAFGAPWLWVTNGATGRSEPFFGSDRWHHVYEFLGLPYQNVVLLPPSGSGEAPPAKL
ncbi:thioredoxin-like protein [Hypoxylon sp. FL1284]|nr:thioredoxin-like protein [Hypoxylon sp. FL1284]